MILKLVYQGMGADKIEPVYIAILLINTAVALIYIKLPEVSPLQPVDLQRFMLWVFLQEP